VPAACAQDYGHPGAKCVNPYVLQQRYGFDLPLTSAAMGNSLAVAEFQTQNFDDADLSSFSMRCGLSPKVAVTRQVGSGAQSTDCSNPLLVYLEHLEGEQACGESLLDIEYIGAIGGAIPLSVYYMEDYSILEWAESVHNNVAPEKVHSVSYGSDEMQQTDEDSTIDTTNIALMKIAAQGISVLIAAGDQGAFGREGTAAGDVFHPAFPADSPWITAVGGTNFKTKNVIGEETAWPNGGGGFSGVIPMPNWQKQKVEAYLRNPAANLPPSRLYTPTGRAYPDISALAGEVNPYLVSYVGGQMYSGVAGTSAATPVVAGMIAQINNARMAAGKPAVGYLNPALYAADADVFHDVTSGKNSHDQTTNTPYGFTAIAGWDAATGLGTPNFPNLKAAAMNWGQGT